LLLCIDIGNTNIHLGVFRGEELLATWEMSNRRSRTADEMGVLLKTLLQDRGIDPRNIVGSIVACVVPPITILVEEMIRRYFGIDPVFVGMDSAAGLLSNFDEPQEVGADRIANAVGGFERYGGPLIVVDFGTATTFDAISKEGFYLGGAIAPGIAISTEALFSHASKLPKIELIRPPRAVGRDTVSSMQAGIVFGYAGLVEALVNRITLEVGNDARVVATGGLADLIARETGVITEVNRHLTLEGMRILHQRIEDREDS
jgi:type III pantothenate kinase